MFAACRLPKKRRAAGTARLNPSAGEHTMSTAGNIWDMPVFRSR